MMDPFTAIFPKLETETKEEDDKYIFTLSYNKNKVFELTTMEPLTNEDQLRVVMAVTNIIDLTQYL